MSRKKLYPIILITREKLVNQLMEEVDQAKQETVNAQKREEQAKIELTSKQSTIVSLQVRKKNQI